MLGLGELSTLPVTGPSSLPNQKILVANGEIEFVGTLNATEYDAFVELANVDHFGILDNFPWHRFSAYRWFALGHSATG